MSQLETNDRVMKTHCYQTRILSGASCVFMKVGRKLLFCLVRCVSSQPTCEYLCLYLKTLLQNIPPIVMQNMKAIGARKVTSEISG